MSRLELISSLKGLRPTNRRPNSDDDDDNSNDGPDGILKSNLARGSGRNAGGRRHRGRRKTVDWDLKNGGKEGGPKRKRMYSEAVSHLSQMCDSLADYLSANANTSDEEEEYMEKYTEDEKESDEEKETEYEKETEDEDHDDDEDDLVDEDDDVADDEIDIAETDEDDIDIAETEDDDDEEDENVEDEDEEEDEKDEELEAVVSGESRDAVNANSPYASSHGSDDDYEEDASIPASPCSPLSPSEQTTVVKSGEQLKTEQIASVNSREEDGSDQEVDMEVSVSEKESTKEQIEKDDSSETLAPEARTKPSTVTDVEQNSEQTAPDVKSTSSSNSEEKGPEVSANSDIFEIKNRTEAEEHTNVDKQKTEKSNTTLDTPDTVMKDPQNVAKDELSGDHAKDTDDHIKGTSEGDNAPESESEIAKDQVDGVVTPQIVGDEGAFQVEDTVCTDGVTETPSASSASVNNNPDRTCVQAVRTDNSNNRTDGNAKDETTIEEKEDKADDEEDADDDEDADEDVDMEEDEDDIDDNDSRDGDVEDGGDDDESGDDGGIPGGDDKTSLGTPVIWTR